MHHLSDELLIQNNFTLNFVSKTVSIEVDNYVVIGQMLI